MANVIDELQKKNMESLYGGQPLIPTLTSPLNKDGTLPGKYKLGNQGTLKAGQLDINSLKGNQSALNELRSRATSQGPSAWLQMQLEQQRLNELTAADGASAGANQAANTAISNLAMNGGMGGGASERIATGAARDAALSRQGIARQGQLDRMALGSQDEQNKLSTLGTVAGLDLNAAAQLQDMNKFNVSAGMDADKFNLGMANDAAKFNIGNSLVALDRDNQNKLTTYGEQMKGYAAGKTAQATQNSGKK